MDYPTHIYDPIRVEVANAYIKREMRKYLPSVRTRDVWKNIDRDIDQWFENNQNIAKIRDYWNGFHGIAMGFKLKNGLIQLITAQNVSWVKVDKLPLDGYVATGAGIEYIFQELSGNQSATDLRIFFEKHVDLAKFWKTEFEKHAETSEERDNFPIIAIKVKGVALAHDGNRRLILAVLQRKKTIPAYLGHFTDGTEIPKNYWLPTSVYMDIVKSGEIAGAYEETLALLKKMIPLSESGEYELRERVLIGENEFRLKLKRDIFGN